RQGPRMDFHAYAIQHVSLDNLSEPTAEKPSKTAVLVVSGKAPDPNHYVSNTTPQSNLVRSNGGYYGRISSVKPIEHGIARKAAHAEQTRGAGVQGDAKMPEEIELYFYAGSSDEAAQRLATLRQLFDNECWMVLQWPDALAPPHFHMRVRFMD